MAKPDQPSREERLAAKLRENLRRRKAQARALETQDGVGGSTQDSAQDSTQDSASACPGENDSRTLPKLPPES